MEKVQFYVSAIIGPKLEASTVSVTTSFDLSRESVSGEVEKFSLNVNMDTMIVCFGEFNNIVLAVCNFKCFAWPLFIWDNNLSYPLIFQAAFE